MGFWDKHLGGGGQPQPPVYPPQQQGPPIQPQQFQQPQQWQQPGQQQYPHTPQSMEEALRQDVTEIPQRAVANRVETGHCPGCGGPNWFTGQANGTPVKPHCYDCGYPFIQAGSGMGELAHVQAKGPARAAMQPNTAPPEQSMVQGMEAF